MATQSAQDISAETTNAFNKHNHTRNILTKQDIEEVNSEAITAVFGYMRDAESSLDRKLIPIEVTLICLSYYYLDDNEYFANVHSDYRTVNSEKEISIERLTESTNAISAFGNVLIPSEFGGVYVWKFQCFSDVFCVGISTEHIDTNINFYNQKKGHNYSMDNEGCFIKNGKDVSGVVCGDIEHGDVVTMTLDLYHRTLKYKCDGRDDFEDEGLDEDSKFQIIDFSISY